MAAQPRSAKKRLYLSTETLDEPKDPCQAASVRIVGLDVGSKTIGIAVSDELGMYAHPVRTLTRRGTHADVEQVRAVCTPWSVGTIVVGLPYDVDGNEGRRAVRVRVFGDALAQAGYTVLYQDEQFSTVRAEDMLLALNRSRRKRKQVIDQAAAVVILQDWLDAHPVETP